MNTRQSRRAATERHMATTTRRTNRYHQRLNTYRLTPLRALICQVVRAFGQAGVQQVDLDNVCWAAWAKLSDEDRRRIDQDRAAKHRESIASGGPGEYPPVT